MLTIYNSLNGKKESFRPMEPGKVRMYVCGMTVYDLCHIGHARVMVVFDMVARYLRASGFDVTYVRNITDIDDKIIQRANENGESIGDLTGRFIGAMHEDSAALRVLPPDIEPRATTSMGQILGMISTLVDKGYAYPADNGDVYYSVARFETYGKLSGKQLEDLRAGARVGVDEAKRDPLDFVLWKSAKPGEPQWDSPWGPGRPGWHIECSAMSTHCLGNHFDIHGGGMDLQFPHHENEIAQSEAATGEHFVNVWMHNGFVRVDDEKMSKSLGNFFTIRDVLKNYDAEVIRYFILNSHYRSPLNYSDVHLDEARSALTTLYTALRGLNVEEISIEDALSDQNYGTRYVAAMDDDFNSAGALAVMFDLAHDINRTRTADPTEAARLGGLLRALAGPLGLLEREPEAFLQGAVTADDDELGADEIERLIAARKTAREEKDWSESDRIRDLLKDSGVLLEDSAEGTTWRRA